MKSLLSCLVLLFMGSATLVAGELDVRMAKIVKTFTRAAADTGLSTATLAVLPFQTDKKLAEKRVDHACAEILTNRFMEAKTFKVTERARLEEVLKEQKLGLSGAVESATAAKVGQLLGARLVILGSVARLGAVYHLSTEMVDSHSGEILASDVTEVAAEVFDKDAAQYVTLVPEYDALGLYFVGGYGSITPKKLPPVTSGSQTFTPTNKDGFLRYFGVGVRYYLSPKWRVDVAAILSAIFENTSTLANVNSGQPVTIKGGFSSSAQRLVIDRVFSISEKVKAQAGVGLFAPPDGQYEDTAQIEVSGASTLSVLRCGLEWKPTQRSGWSFSGSYYGGKTTYKGTTKGNGGVFPNGILVREFDFPKFTFETNLSIYF